MIAAYIMVAVFANVGNYGIAVIQFHLGDAGLGPATMYYVIMSVTQLYIGISAAGWAHGGGKGALVNTFHLGHYQYVAGIMQMAMPTAVMATIVAKENGIAPHFVNSSVLFAILASLGSLPLVMVLL